MSLLSDLINLNLSDTTEKVIAEYLWIGGSGMDLRSKARTLPGPVSDPSELPKWSYNGSSTGQAPGEDSEVILYPQAIFKDPFRRDNNILVICDTYTPAGEPTPTNKRHKAAEIFSHPEVVAEEPWFYIKQEYSLLPRGWPVVCYPCPQELYDKGIAADIVHEHYKACVYAGIGIFGFNDYAVGISAGDEVWVARYILERITEKAGLIFSLDPKPIQGDYNGAGFLAKYSTKSMRSNGGCNIIKKGIDTLLGLMRRLFRGVANCGAYWRPASNIDPYVVTAKIAETTILSKR